MRRDPRAEVGPSELKAETLQESLEVARAMTRGVQQAQEENRRRGLPNVVTRDGRLLEELSDGSVRVVDGPAEIQARAR